MNEQRRIDVREFAEFAGGAIEDSELVPLGTLEEVCGRWDKDTPLEMVCKSGGRARQAQERLLALGFSDVRVLEGGIDGWIANGKSVVRMERRPWSLERQVRVGAGSMVVISLLLAWTVSPLFLSVTALVGAGLVFAGATDICLMARLLSKLPWNHPRSSPVQ